MKSSDILVTSASPQYELLDSGEGEKLERFGPHLLSRPDPQALWRKRLDAAHWKKAGAHFIREEKGGGWSLKKDIPPSWDILFEDLTVRIKPTAFKHTGLFPEQAANWRWIGDQIARRRAAMKSGEELEVLNLFGYTGGASLVCARAGAKVVHIDSSKAAVAWARENAGLSGLGDKPIRWITEDARVFVSRERKRGRKYAAILMDPPAFGHGPASELWKIEEHFLPLIEDCMALLHDRPLFFLVNGYSAGYSALAYENNLLPLVRKHGGRLETGELALRESDMPQLESRLLPAGIFARWSF